MDNLHHKISRKAVFVYTICLLILSPIIEAQPNSHYFLFMDCPNTTFTDTSTYAPNSTYQTNLNTLLSVLSANSNNSNGFYNFTVGSSPPDVAYGLFLCRGDFSTADCQDCVVSASKGVVERCPGSKRVSIWYDPYCMIRYSNESIFSTLDVGFRRILRNPQNVTNATLFTENLGKVLMDDIATRASSDDSGKKFATAEVTYSKLQPIYVLGQCTPDLSDSDCYNCLWRAISSFPSCCDANLGARVSFSSCYVHYEMYPFYNDSVGAAPPPPSPVLPPPTTNNPPRSPGNKGKQIAIGASVSASVVVAFLGFCIYYQRRRNQGIYYQRRRKRTTEEERENNQEVQLRDLAQGRLVDDYSTGNLQGEKPPKSQDFPSIQLDLVLAVTKHFSEENKLGEGGFGPVYKGTLPDGKEIAVKRLSRNSGQGLQEFKNEISLIAKLQHRNLVRLLGCCLEGNELMLIYEYMPNKSLDFFLFDSTKAAQLDWKRRFLIINGIARGLLYLHEDSRLRIIHRDLKVSNILLDQEMNPKISDFGMARIFDGNQSEANTNRVVGTYGYMAPEYAMEGLFSVKSDVFSFGVLLLEIISGKKNSGFYLSEQGHSLLTYAWNLWCKDEEILELMDPLLMESSVATEVLKCIHIGLLCVQEDPADRPTMSTIVATLVMDAIANRASSDDSGKKFTTREANYSLLQPVYGPAQCTPDLSDSQCITCLQSCISQFPSCCNGKQRGRILFHSCNVRYEMYPFYNASFGAAPPPPSPVLPPPPPPPPPPTTTTIRSRGNGGISSQVIIAIVVPTGVAIMLFIAGFCCLTRRTKKKYNSVKQDNVGDDMSTVKSLQYDFGTVQAATNNFSDDNIIGEGGFGQVYKGLLPDGQQVAVKRLSKTSGQGAQEFKNEVALVAKLQHRNLVRLLGFCLEGEEKILIYEFVPNKSLDYFLFDPREQAKLDWSRRYKIIGGVARGMLYLHEDSRLRIIHRDLKASNILLDDDMNAKISDFGMARIFGVDQTHGSTRQVVGTFGYMSPEYVMHGRFSVKSDVFSFGVLILEIICGKKNNNFYQSDGATDLLSYAWKHWSEGTPLDFMDPTLEGSYSRNEVTRCIHIGLLCVQDDPDARPSMARVVLMLNSYSTSLSLPQQPAFLGRSRTGSYTVENIESDQSTSKSIQWSVNEASITELDPR